MQEHEILRMILQNKLICSVSEPEAYSYIKANKDNYERISGHLKPFGIKLVTLFDGEAFAGLNIIPTDEDRNAVVKTCIEVRQSIGPIIEMLTCLASSNPKNNALQIGQRLSHAQLVLEANNNKHFESMLNQLAETLGVSKKTNDQQVEALLERLRKFEILKLINSAQKMYQATAMLLYVYQLLEHIRLNVLSLETNDDIEGVQEDLL